MTRRFNPVIHHRKSTRLRGYDYSTSGAYFVTVCTRNKECLFGAVVDGEVHLNRFGQIASEEWYRSAELRAEMVLDAFVVMPNHLHGIVILDPVTCSNDSGVGAHGRAPLRDCTALHRPKRSLGSFIALFKSMVAKRVNEINGTPGQRLWQRNYYEHIIRTERSLDLIREYIALNPRNWMMDQENPAIPAATNDFGKDLGYDRKVR